MSAILFGSISTVADTSEMQRKAFNEAFSAHGLEWRWDRDEYQDLLTSNGGNDRIADYARKVGQDVDASAIHNTKSTIFQEALANTPLTPRSGVIDTVRGARDHGWKVALVTTTSTANVDALLAALSGHLSAADFDLVVDAGRAAPPKPDPAAYVLALDALAYSADACVAIEDNVGGVHAAMGAGVTCVAFANENTAGHHFGEARRVERLAFPELAALTSDS